MNKFIKGEQMRLKVAFKDETVKTGFLEEDGKITGFYLDADVITLTRIGEGDAEFYLIAGKTKTCPGCGNEVPREGYNSYKSRGQVRDGLQSRCRVCQKKINAERQARKKAEKNENE